MVDPWEARSESYRPTAEVLDHFREELRAILPDVQVAFLCGSDLAATMGVPGVWSQEDLDHSESHFERVSPLLRTLTPPSTIVLGQYKVFVLERHGTDMDSALAALQSWRQNIYVMPQLIPNEISSTRVRIFLRKSMSVRYLISSPVMEYIERYGLYSEDDNDREMRKNGLSGSTKEAKETMQVEREQNAPNGAR
jgi:nicotinamide mononucleotide adenylyltransferase